MADAVDDSELRQLHRDLTEVAAMLPREIALSVQQAGIETKKVWAADARSKAGKRTRRYAASIDYDARSYGGFGQIVHEVQIGPNLARYGGKTGKGGLVPSLGILEESKGVRGGNRGSIKVAYDFAVEEFDRRMEIAIDQSMRKRGL